MEPVQFRVQNTAILSALVAEELFFLGGKEIAVFLNK